MLKKQRFRNYGLWISVASQVLLLVQLIGHLTGAFTLTDVMKHEILAIIDLILGILATLGIISNPTKPRSGGYNL
ncbi:Bacteriophage holin [compost metagenome]